MTGRLRGWLGRWIIGAPFVTLDDTNEQQVWIVVHDRVTTITVRAKTFQMKVESITPSFDAAGTFVIPESSGTFSGTIGGAA